MKKVGVKNHQLEFVAIYIKLYLKRNHVQRRLYHKMKETWLYFLSETVLGAFNYE